MVDIKEVKENVDSLAEDLAGALEVPSEDESVEDESVEGEGGIFDEDFEIVDEEAPVGDFDIGSTMLTAAAPVVSWGGQNLEEELSRDFVKQDWDDDPDAFSGDFYKSSNDVSGAYGTAGSDVYSSGGGRGGGVYSEAGGAYDAAKGGTYSAQGGDVGALKGYEQLKDERGDRRSMLESMGFQDNKKKDKREFNTDAVAYQSRDAA